MRKLWPSLACGPTPFLGTGKPLEDGLFVRPIGVGDPPLICGQHPPDLVRQRVETGNHRFARLPGTAMDPRRRTLHLGCEALVQPVFSQKGRVRFDFDRQDFALLAIVVGVETAGLFVQRQNRPRLFVGQRERHDEIERIDHLAVGIAAHALSEGLGHVGGRGDHGTQPCRQEQSWQQLLHFRRSNPDM